VLGVLRKLGRMERSRSVWIGVAAAVVASIAAGLALNALGLAFEGCGGAIFEGAAMLLAAGVLTWMIFWMQRHWLCPIFTAPQGKNCHVEENG
jgi:high-affinity iron transporter